MEISLQKNPKKKFKLVPLDNVEFPHLLTKKETLVGRSDSCDLVIDSAHVSSIHASIKIIDDKVLIIDLESTNGTFKDQEKVEKIYLEIGETITFGNSTFRLEARLSEGTKTILLKDFQDHLHADASEAPPNLPSGPVEPGQTDVGQATRIMVNKKEFLGTQTQLMPSDALKKMLAEKQEAQEKSTAQDSNNLQIDLATLIEKTRQEAKVSTNVANTAKATNDTNEKSQPPIGKKPSLIQKIRDVRKLPAISPLNNRPLPKNINTTNLPSFEVDESFNMSEYIFEDLETVYPIFNYDLQENTIEIMVLADDLILSVDYFPATGQTYFVTGGLPNESQVGLPTLKKRKSVVFSKTTVKQKIMIYPLADFQAKYFGETERAIGADPFEMKMGDIVYFYKDQLKIHVRIVTPPPTVISPPFMGRDNITKKIVLPSFLITATMFGILSLVDTSILKEKTIEPERITQILFRPPPPPPPTPRPVKVEEAVSEVETVAETPTEVKPPAPANEPPIEPPKKVETVTEKKQPPPKKSQELQTAAKPEPAKKVFRKFDFSQGLQALTSQTSNLKNFQVANSGKDVNVSANAPKGFSGSTQIDKDSKVEGFANQELDTSIGMQGINTNKEFGFSNIMKKTVVLGSIDPQIIRDLLNEFIPQFRHCYDLELDRHQNKVRGTIYLTFTIGSSGHVTGGLVNSNNFKVSSAGQNCLMNVLQGIRFPAPKGGGKVEIKQPIYFEPQV